LRLSIGLQLGGAFGNLLDRLTAGAVVDFIDVGWWPIFNLADSSIVVGMTILVGTLLFFDKKPPEQEESGVDEQERSAAGSP
jgi:signal peptidase II